MPDDAMNLALTNISGQMMNNSLNWLAGASENKKSRKWGEQMAEWTYQKDLEMWNTQNRYNSPEMQMARYAKAGLNPNLIYGQGTPGNASQMPRYNLPEGKFGLPYFNIDWSGILAQYNDMRVKNEQIETMKLARSKMQEDINVRKWDAVIRGLEAGVKPAELDHLLNKQGFESDEWTFKRQGFNKDLEFMDARNQNAFKDLDVKASQIDLNKGSLKEKEENLRWLQEKWREYNQTGLNIDRDPYVPRILRKLGEEAVKGINNEFDMQRKFRKGLVPKDSVEGSTKKSWNNVMW